MKYIIPETNFNLYFEIIFSLIVVIILTIHKTKSILKKLILFNFITISILNWTNYFFILIKVDILINKYTFINNYLDFKYLNIFNVIYIFILEIFFYIWSYLTYQNNISDWYVPLPVRADLKPLYNITIFYLGILIYYIIFNRIS